MLLFAATVDAGYTWLAVLAAARTVISLAYLPRVLAPSYFEPLDHRQSRRIQEDEDMPREVDLHEVQRLLGQGAQLVDVMGRKECESSHILGAVHIPCESWLPRHRAGSTPAEP